MSRRFIRVGGAGALLAPLLFLAACGFQLRGGGAGAALARVHVGEAGAAPLAEALRLALEQAGSSLRPGTGEGAGEANWRVLVSGERLARELLSVNPSTGKAEEYQLRLYARLRLEDRQGQVLIRDEPVQVLREYSYDAAQALAMSEQETEIRTELRRWWAQLALERLGRAAAEHSAAGHSP